MTDDKAGGQFFLQEFDRRQLATLQTWLAEAGAALPPFSAATISRSLRNWQDWADVNAAADGWTTPAASAAVPTTSVSVAEALRAQASAWHALLAGQTDVGGQISVDAWVRAGQRNGARCLAHGRPGRSGLGCHLASDLAARPREAVPPVQQRGRRAASQDSSRTAGISGDLRRPPLTRGRAGAAWGGGRGGLLMRHLGQAAVHGRTGPVPH
jgi:hypothetical protein